MNATFVTLARNSDVWEIAKSIRQVEDRFNRKFNYDWVFLNDAEFDDTFKRVTTALVSGKTKYGKIPKEHWSFPDWIDQDKAARVREDMREKKIIYGDSVSYRHMCRYESGFFFQHPLMLDYEWYWRVEPSVELFCDIDYDTFKYMADNGKKYSFVLSLYEYVETIPTLWDTVLNFTKAHPEHLAEGNSMRFVSDDGGKTYNHCHFVSTSNLDDSSNPAVVQLRDRQPQLAAVQGVHGLLQLPRPRRRLLLRALGRRAGAQRRRVADAQEGRDPLLQRHCLLPRAVHALPDGRGPAHEA
jgi:alpha 1,2-mannosyltransferase